MKDRPRVFTGLDIVFFALCGISLTFSKAIKRMNSLKKEELVFSSEEQDNAEPSDINGCETKSERELPIAKPSPISHSREGSLRSSSSEDTFFLLQILNQALHATRSFSLSFPSFSSSSVSYEIHPRSHQKVYALLLSLSSSSQTKDLDPAKKVSKGKEDKMIRCQHKCFSSL